MPFTVTRKCPICAEKIGIDHAFLVESYSNCLPIIMHYYAVISKAMYTALRCTLHKKGRDKPMQEVSLGFDQVNFSTFPTTNTVASG